jgi:hypothetical protein
VGLVTDVRSLSGFGSGGDDSVDTFGVEQKPTFFGILIDSAADRNAWLRPRPQQPASTNYGRPPHFAPVLPLPGAGMSLFCRYLVIVRGDVEADFLSSTDRHRRAVLPSIPRRRLAKQADDARRRPLLLPSRAADEEPLEQKCPAASACICRRPPTATVVT